MKPNPQSVSSAVVTMLAHLERRDALRRAILSVPHFVCSECGDRVSFLDALDYRQSDGAHRDVCPRCWDYLAGVPS
jgi:transcription initiation factor IIE alpha subunit